ncbi:uncharacterized protein CANTADRAFT_262433 [Suhomyces tanzawaensis NRRL Y-17324]|uniref:Uncharacterized protein n=1 Tax=Suhomyces tanzawaensis NRRL Y-17324 TaxID=984487 RepID=A0A1E4SFG1_9ASCO|nr:uncharacterized protein CANTADRAFT_262433 [Suhomyces tanzawaensis NRRL Y-17324]ODV78257.1 hypothetical protein CANTADRAFT_262433 [Suhomyces tanzawaensis NRRL Y-17324]
MGWQWRGAPGVVAATEAYCARRLGNMRTLTRWGVLFAVYDVKRQIREVLGAPPDSARGLLAHWPGQGPSQSTGGTGWPVLAHYGGPVKWCLLLPLGAAGIRLPPAVALALSLRLRETLVRSRLWHTSRCNRLGLRL